MGEIKQIHIKNRTCYFYNDIVVIKHFDAGLLKIDKKSYKNMVFTTMGISQRKKLINVIIFTV